MESKYIVTGDMGFVGSHLRKAVKAPEGIDLRGGVDVSVREELAAILDGYEPKVIFHLAAVTQVVDGLSDPAKCFTNNILSTINVLEEARIRGLRVVLMSSDKVYGEGMDKKETDPLNAVYPYDVSKKCCEDIARSYFDTYGVDVIIVRSCNIYGPNDQNIQRIVPGMVAAAKSNAVFDIRSDGKLLREYIYVADVVEALRRVARVGEAGQVYNIGSGEVMSVLDMVEAFKLATGVDLQYRVLGKAEAEISKQSINCEKLKALGWECKNKFAEVINVIYRGR